MKYVRWFCKGLVFMLFVFFAFSMSSVAQNIAQQKWIVSGTQEIKFDFSKSENLPYSDNIEMSGKRVAGIISYSIDSLGKLTLEREIFFPQLHQFKNSEDSWYHDYRAYLQDTYKDDLLPKLYIKNEEFVPGKIQGISIDGTLNFEHAASRNGLSLSR